MIFKKLGKLTSVPSSQSGFSLIEVVISLSIFSLVIGLLYSGFWTSTRLLTRDDSEIKKLEKRLLVQRLIPKWFENSIVTTEGNRSKHLFFSGTQKSVTFFSMQKHYTDTPVLYKIKLTIENNNTTDTEKSQLNIVQRIEKPFFASNRFQANVQKSTVEFSSEITGFSYLESSSGVNDESAWSNTWEQEQLLPFAVRLDTKDGDQITALPRNRLDAECLSRRGIEGLAGRFCNTNF